MLHFAGTLFEIAGARPIGLREVLEGTVPEKAGAELNQAPSLRERGARARKTVRCGSILAPRGGVSRTLLLPGYHLG
jgi:hypothetical protein